MLPGLGCAEKEKAMDKASGNSFDFVFTAFAWIFGVVISAKVHWIYIGRMIMTRWKGGINKKTIITCAMDFLIITHVIYMAVHYQIQYWIGKGDLRKIEIYLSSGASSNDKFDGGYTPLIIAVMNHKESAVGLLLDYGADPNLAVDDGSTPLHFAVRTRDHEAIRILLDNGANPNLSSPMARVSPFELAIGMEDMPMVRLFVEKGAVVQRHDADRVNDSDLADYLKSKLPDA